MIHANVVLGCGADSVREVHALAVAARLRPQTPQVSVLLSTRIKADIGVAAARELFAAGFRTPQRMDAASWQQRRSSPLVAADVTCRWPGV